MYCVWTAGISEDDLGQILTVLYQGDFYGAYPVDSEPPRRYGHACMVAGDPLGEVEPAFGTPRKLYVMGGEGGQGRYLRDLWQLDLPTRIGSPSHNWSWTRLQPIDPAPPGLKWHTLGLLREPLGALSLAAFGGQKQAPRAGSSGESTRALEVLDP